MSSATDRAAVSTHVPPEKLNYPGLITLMLTSFVLVTAEFLPTGLLTEMAADLGVSTGQAGQMVSITALVGFFAALGVGLVFPRLDRRTLLVGLALAAAISDLVVAMAPNLVLILISRALLGAALSGFWSMSLAIAAHIAGPERLGRAVMFTTAGLSLATVAGVPLGTLLASAADWRWVFATIGVLSAAVAIALRVFLPAVPAERTADLGVLRRAVRMPGVRPGLIGHVLTVFGHIAAYTYIRAALERIGDDESTTVLLLALFGVGGVAGNIATGPVVDRHLALLSGLVPAMIGVTVLTVIAAPGSIALVGAAIFLWGAAFSAWLIVLNTWIGRRTPGHLEAGGALSVAGFQLAITLAAAAGGLAIDLAGVVVVYLIGFGSVAIGTVVFFLAGRVPAALPGDDDPGTPVRRDHTDAPTKCPAESLVRGVAEQPGNC